MLPRRVFKHENFYFKLKNISDFTRLKMYKQIMVLYLLISLFGCDTMTKVPVIKIDPIEEHTLEIPEPSDITLAGDKLWIVSDRDKTVYKTDLEGNVEFSFHTDEPDLEGITIFDNSFLAITLEKKRVVIVTDLEGNAVSKHKIDIDGNKNSGLEGITYNPSNQHFYLVNEKDPALIVETDKNFNEVNRQRIREVADLSGISYSAADNCLWLLSDEDRMIIKYSFEGDILARHKINVNQPEGIAVDDKNNLIYIVSDREEKLLVYKKEIAEE